MSNKLNLPLAFCTLFVHLLLDVPSSSDGMIANTVRTGTKSGSTENIRRNNPKKRGQYPNEKCWQNAKNGDARNDKRNYRTVALHELKQQWELQKSIANKAGRNVKETAKKAKSHLLFGLDKLPESVHQNAHLPAKLVKLNKDGKVSSTMQNLGKRMYDGIWHMSKKLKELPPKTAAVLAVIFGYAEIAHTRDEWSQATLNPLITPENVGFSLPRTMEEFKEGLINAALDILPDFAFAVPVSLFVANPPAAILWAGWLAVGEYFAKKSWSLVLRDIVLPTKSGGKFMELLQKTEVPVERVFPKEVEEDDENEPNAAHLILAEQEELGEGSKGQKETMPVIEALAASQVNSNLYQYLFMNTLRAYYVTATSIYSHFMDNIEKAEDEPAMTEFAKDMKNKMVENEEVMKEKQEKSTGKSKNSKFQWIMGKPKIAKKSDQNTVKDIDLVNDFVSVKMEPISTRWVETMVKFNNEMLTEMDEEEREKVKALAEGIAHKMVYKEAKNKNMDAALDNESLNTTARLIEEISTSPDVLEEMVKVKSRGRKIPKCDSQIEEAHINREALISDVFGTNDDHFPICEMENGPKIDQKAQIAFLPVLDEEMKKDLGFLQEKMNEVKSKLSVVKKFSVAGGLKKEQKPAESSKVNSEQQKGLKEIGDKVKKANNTSKVLTVAGQSNRTRKRYMVTKVPHNSGANPMIVGQLQMPGLGLASLAMKK
ncbi:hypothetical protein niasHS_007925 [Heterodera schachtii]|uniref:Uncharacterized protein n=1 Tax=Heterodera schachtii TaxID=97005 RepID=A0ABD2JQ15_HETSC